MTTTNDSVNAPFSGSTGTVNFVGATSPTLITPILGAATATKITFSPTTNGIVGTTAADNAAAGEVGEFVSTVVLYASSVSVSSSTATSVASISLTAGDWNVWGNVTCQVQSASTITGIYTAINTSVALPDKSLQFVAVITAGPGNVVGTLAPMQRINISTTTTLYVVSSCFVSAGTAKLCGGIYARRIR